MGEAALAALTSLADPSLLVMLLAGVVAGLVIGLIPGLGGTGAVAVLMPVTFGMEAPQALALLIGALAVVHTSDTVAAVLLGAPGSASASVTMLDGYAMARKGQAARALSLAFLSSMAGGLIGAVGLTLAIPLAGPLVTSFGSPELFMLTVLGVALAAVLSRGNVAKGLVAGSLGLLLGMVGTSPTTAEYRFTFGSLFLGDGFSLVAVALGVFGLAEIASRVGQRGTTRGEVRLGGGWLAGVREWAGHWAHVLRGSLIGIWAGVLPGIGATAGTWLAYGQAVATAKDKRKFGKGDPRGIVGPESANNSVEAGDLIPTLLFGIPGGVPAAMLLGMLLTYGVQPGPAIVTDHLDLMYLIVWSFAIASVLGALLCFLGTRWLARLTEVPFAVLGPGLVVIMLLGAFQESGQIGDLWVMVALGVVGWLLKATGFPRAPFLIGFVLAIPLERYYFLTDRVYDGFGWLARPWVLVFLAILVAPCVLALVRGVRARRAGVRATDSGPVEPQDEAVLADSPWSLLTAAGALALFAAGFVVAGGYSEEARLVPQLICAAGAVVSAWLLWREWTGIRRRKDSGGAPGAGGGPASGTGASAEAEAGSGLASGSGTAPAPVPAEEREGVLVGAATAEATAIAAGPEATAAATRGEAAGARNEVAVAGRTFAWMAAFLVLVALGGYIAALLLFVPAFLLYVARARVRTVVAYTLVAAALVGILPALLPVDLPIGLLPPM
ncbi:tripartite tricarboxylate transporter permease [Nocardiopsis sediminis]|uniref:Tripartite tricarboxylate transporter permease n=1 Tax=Nocardiopsis sediminis TaxID=1778267 RepID=A0ABV8FL24_9ACTN